MTADCPASDAALRLDAARWLMAAQEQQRDEPAFARWYGADLRHRQAYDHLLRLWQAGADVPSAHRARRHLRRRGAHTALGLLALAGIAMGTALLPADAQRTQVQTAAGQTRMFLLPDGSRAQLSAATTLQLDYDEGQRTVHLRRGQAWFQVQPDAQRPFVVSTRDGTVTALGTAFMVDQQASASLVSVTEHQVRIDRDGLPPVQVNEGQQARFDARGEVQPTAADRSALAWREQRLVFVSRPLGEVLAALDQWDGGHTLLTDPVLATQPVTLITATGQATASRDLLERQLPVRVWSVFGLHWWKPRAKKDHSAP